MLTKTLLIALILMGIFISCKKSSNSNNTNPGNIYVAGYNSGLAGYWKNNIFSVLNDSNNIAEVNSIRLSGSDIFTTGLKYQDTTEYAVYWKNHQVYHLTNGKIRGDGLSLAIQGSDIYVCGYEGSIAKYWKNGIGINLTDGKYMAWANSIKVLGKGIYISGMENGVGKYWINGAAYTIPPVPGQYIGADMEIGANGVYLVGSVPDPTIKLPYNTGSWEPSLGTKAVYWLNGQIHYLEDGNYSAYATNIAISGSDIYIVGMDNSGDLAHDVEGGTYFHSVIKLWKNGVPISITDGKWDAFVNSIMVSGKDIYLAGNELSSMGRKAIYWKNGTPTILANQGSGLTSIALGK